MDKASLNSRPDGDASQASSPTDPSTGSVLGRYELLLPIAKGGMAQVWAARLRGTRGFQKLVAIKTILADSIDSTRLEQMFLEEAQLASQIHHPNVVTTLDLGEHEGTLYLVMEWVDGEPLNQVIARASTGSGMPLPVAVNLIGQACKGLHAAHTLRDDSGALLGVVHRDVSPQNLLVTFSGTAKLVDFGLAKVTSKASHLTEAGEVKGKFAYMAPEQVAGQAIDCRADLFSLGIILYWITTGKHPFRGNHPGQTLRNICSEGAPALPSTVLSGYPSALEAVVMKALEKAPERRFESANQMLTALEAALPGPLEASFEMQVAEYMGRLFGSRASERRAAIREAQEHADRQRVEQSAISLGTLRTISIERPEGATDSTPARFERKAVEAQVAPPLPLMRRLPSWVAPAGGALLVTCGIAFSLLPSRLADAPSTTGPTPAGAEIPSATAFGAELPEQTQTTQPPSAPSTAAPPAGSDPPTSDTPIDAGARGNSTDRLKGTRLRPSARLAASDRPTSRASPAPGPSSAPAANPPAAPAPETSSPPASNAWDRDAFGGRF